MNGANITVRQRGSLFWKFYITAWALLGSVAVFYISVAANRPDFFTVISGKAALQAKQAELEQQTRDAAALNSLRDDVQNLKLKLDLAQVHQAATPKPQTQPQNKSRPPSERQTLPENTDEAEIPPLPDRWMLNARSKKAAAIDDDNTTATIVINDKQTSPIITGSTSDAGPEKPGKFTLTLTPNTPVVVFGAPTVIAEAPFEGTLAEQSFTDNTAIVISAATSLSELRSTWQRLADRHPELLGTLRARYDLTGLPDAKYRLLAGPLPDRTRADRLCAQLAMQNVKCSVSNFIGKVL